MIYTTSCPYCGSVVETNLELGETEYGIYEDCSTCCRPILFSITMDWRDLHPVIIVKREDD